MDAGTVLHISKIFLIHKSAVHVHVNIEDGHPDVQGKWLALILKILEPIWQFDFVFHGNFEFKMMILYFNDHLAPRWADMRRFLAWMDQF